MSEIFDWVRVTADSGQLTRAAVERRKTLDPRSIFKLHSNDCPVEFCIVIVGTRQLQVGGKYCVIVALQFCDGIKRVCRCVSLAVKGAKCKR